MTLLRDRKTVLFWQIGVVLVSPGLVEGLLAFLVVYVADAL